MHGRRASLMQVTCAGLKQVTAASGVPSSACKQAGPGGGNRKRGSIQRRIGSLGD
jgi:hypothetical protein